MHGPVNIHAPTDLALRQILRLAESFCNPSDSALGLALRNMAIYAMIMRDEAYSAAYKYATTPSEN